MSKSNKYKATLTIEVDLEEYPVPADGKIKVQLGQDIRDALYELDGISIKNMIISGRDLDE